MKRIMGFLVLAPVVGFTVPAFAQIAGVMGGGYTHIDAEHLNATEWTANGSVSGPLAGTGVTLQGNAGYDDATAESVSVNDWSAGGAAFWSTDSFRVGATATYTRLNPGDGVNVHVTNYGGFAEWLPDMFTVAAKAGGFSGSAGVGSIGLIGSANGYYVGGEGAFYLTPNFALSGTVDYANFDAGNSVPTLHETDFTPQLEWLVVDGFPVSVYGGYTYADVSGGGASGNGNAFFLGLRIYLNSGAPMSLIEHHRTGPVGWGTNFGPIGLNL